MKVRGSLFDVYIYTVLRHTCPYTGRWSASTCIKSLWLLHGSDLWSFNISVNVFLAEIHVLLSLQSYYFRGLYNTASGDRNRNLARSWLSLATRLISLKLLSAWYSLCLLQFYSFHVKTDAHAHSSELLVTICVVLAAEFRHRLVIAIK